MVVISDNPLDYTASCKKCGHTWDSHYHKEGASPWDVHCHLCDCHRNISYGDADTETFADTEGNPKDDPVNHPQHYGGDTTYETIKVIEAWGLNFHLGNVIKYISRYGTEDNVEDLEKAKWYLTREIERRRNILGRTYLFH